MLPQSHLLCPPNTPTPDPDTVSLADSSPPLSPFSSQRDGIIAASTCNLQNQQQVTVPSYFSFVTPPPPLHTVQSSQYQISIYETDHASLKQTKQVSSARIDYFLVSFSL